MRLILIVFLIIVSFWNVSGQGRVNRKKICFDGKSGVMTKATGWEYNNVLGEWVDYENVISSDKDFKTKYKSFKGAYMMSSRKQNFINIQTKTLTFKGTKYYVLLVAKWDGSYEYPTIYEDWHYYKMTIGYIFTESEYRKLDNLDKLVMLETKSVVAIGSRYDSYDEIKFLDKIQTSLLMEKNQYTPSDGFVVMKSKEGAIRFYVPSYFSDYKNYDFDKNYFETDYENFSKIILKD